MHPTTTPPPKQPPPCGPVSIADALSAVLERYGYVIEPSAAGSRLIRAPLGPRPVARLRRRVEASEGRASA